MRNQQNANIIFLWEKKRIDANNESLRNQHNAKPTECEYNFSLGKKRIDANNESLRNQ